MREGSNATIGERERILAEAIAPVAAEIRLVDVSILARDIAQGKHGNIDDLVASSTELYFKPGTLRYGLRADVDLRWGTAPAVSLDLEFVHREVTVFFCLTLGSVKAAIDIHAVTVAGAAASPAENTERLRAALQDARLVRHPVSDVEPG